MSISLEEYIEENIFSKSIESQKNNKKWMQKEAEREEKKDTKGSLREYFKLKEDEHITMDMLNKEIEKIKKKYGDEEYPKDILKLIRRLNLAKTYIGKNKNIKK